VLAAKAGDPAARGELVEAFMPLIAAAARPYRNLHVQRVELLQEGVVGLLRALEGFDPARERPFWAYAAWWVRQAMQQLVAELTRPVVLSDRALRSLARLREAHQEALGESGAEPSRGDLAQRTGLSPEQVDDLMATERPVRSLEEPLRGEEGVIGVFGDLIADPLAEGEYDASSRRSRSRSCRRCWPASPTASARFCAPVTGSTARRRACARWAAGWG
jgi:RNA polymerase primary sigma factor